MDQNRSVEEYGILTTAARSMKAADGARRYRNVVDHFAAISKGAFAPPVLCATTSVSSAQMFPAAVNGMVLCGGVSSRCT
jgi:hypothetical protein